MNEHEKKQYEKFNEICSKFMEEYFENEWTKKEKLEKQQHFIKTILSHYINQNVLKELYEKEFETTYHNLEEIDILENERK